jgi:membrane-associated protease RseP (regulator of RpoE activity)
MPHPAKRALAVLPFRSPLGAMPLTMLDRLERRFGRFAIPNLTMILIAGQAVLYVASFLPQGISLDRIALDPAKILQGEVWRLATFLFMPPPTDVILFAVFYFLLFHLFGTTLENHWGKFKYNLFLFIGYVANIVAAFAASAILGELAKNADPLLAMASISASNSFLYGSVFLAFARLYPDFTINLFFVLPIRIKWLALLAWLGYGYAFIRGDLVARLLILASVLNYLLFFGREHWREFRYGRRRRSFQAKAKKALAPAKHTCVVCGVSSADSPKTLFRYCSKCVGQRCYCPEHIRDHEHVTTEEPAAS